MAVTSVSFTSAVAGASLQVQPGESITYAISGTYAATLVLEQAVTADQQAWQAIDVPHSTANATVAGAVTIAGPPVGQTNTPPMFVRLRCSSFTSGTAVTTVTNGPTPLMAPDITLQRNVTIAGDLHTGAEGGSLGPILAGAALTLTAALHAGKTIFLNTLTGSFITLPAATGTMDTYKFVVSVVNTSVNHSIKSSPTTDYFQGIALLVDSATVTGYDAAAISSHTANTILLNGTTKGGLSIGDSFELQDIGAANWQVKNFVMNASGTAATPFSHV